MKKIMYLGAMLVLTMCVSNAFAQDAMPPETKSTTSMKKNADSKFMMTAATSGMNEVALSNTAVSKSTNEEVKQFAQKMIDDHTAAGDELKTLASGKSVMLPAEADAKHMAANTKLQTLSGNDFDMEYIKWMVKDHEKAVALFTKESTGGKDEEAKAWAAKTLPTLQGHLDMAKSMMAKMSGMKSDSKMTDKKMDGMNH